jgi:hypothetical protein
MQSRKEFYLFPIIKTGSGDHPAFYPMGMRGSFTRVKAARI